MKFLWRSLDIAFSIRAYPTSVPSQNSTISSSTVWSSYEALSLLKSQSNPQTIVDICSATALNPSRRPSRRVLSLAVSILSNCNHRTYIISLLKNFISLPKNDCRKSNALSIVLFGKAGMVEEAAALFIELHKGTTFGSVQYLNALLNACVSARNFPEMKRVYYEFPSLYNAAPDLETHNTMIDGLCKHGEVSLSYGILARMNKNGIKPNGKTFEAILRGFLREHNFPEVGNVVKLMMSECYLLPSLRLVSQRIRALCKAGRSGDAQKVFNEMSRIGLVPNTATYGPLIKGYLMESEIEKAKGLYDEMVKSEVKANSFVYDTMVKLYCGEGDFVQSMAMCKEAMQKRRWLYVGTAKMLIRKLVEVGKFEEAEKLRDEVNTNVFKSLVK